MSLARNGEEFDSDDETLSSWQASFRTFSDDIERFPGEFADPFDRRRDLFRRRDGAR